MSVSLFTQFNGLYDVNYKAYTSAPTNELLTAGIAIIEDPNANMRVKEDVLHKLIVIYPENHILYYFMGNLAKSKNTAHALVWYKMCYRICPTCQENLLDMSKILFDTENFNAIQKINDDNDNILYKLNDSRFKLLISAYEAKRRNFERSVAILHELIDMPELNNFLRFICCSNIGVTYNDLGQSDTGIKFLTQAIQLNKEHKVMTALDCKTTYDNLFITYDYSYNNLEEVWSIYKTFNALQVTQNTFKYAKNNKIVLGYISGDFSFHVVANFILPILHNHTADFEIHCFSIRPILDVGLHNIPNTTFHDITELDTLASAQYVNNLHVDILIDLSGHSAHNRLEMLALNPAPIQMTYLGFPNTTGLSCVKYRITDSIADHPYSKQRYSEELYKLPKCFLLYSPLHHTERFDPRIAPRDHIVVGSINKETKTSKELLSVWRMIMESCPRVKFLILLKTDTEARRQFYCDHLNIPRNSDRISFITYLDTEKDYTRLFYQIDVMLDPFPYSGTTTSCKALYNSVPIVTKYHRDYHVHNVTASILVNTGFPELVAHSDEEYVSIVKELSEDPDRIDDYKRKIHDKFSALMEPKKFMQSYETMLKDVYIRNIYAEGCVY